MRPTASSSGGRLSPEKRCHPRMFHIGVGLWPQHRPGNTDLLLTAMLSSQVGNGTGGMGQGEWDRRGGGGDIYIGSRL